jgi:hypothetical protein
MADSNREAAGAKRCAASMAGHPVSVEYSTGSDDGVPFVTVLAVHDRGHRYPAHWFHPDAISDFEDEATRTEMAADECEWGIPDERSTAPMRLAPRVAA